MPEVTKIVHPPQSQGSTSSGRDFHRKMSDSRAEQVFDTLSISIQHQLCQIPLFHEGQRTSVVLVFTYLVIGL